MQKTKVTFYTKRIFFPFFFKNIIFFLSRKILFIIFFSKYIFWEPVETIGGENQAPNEISEPAGGIFELFYFIH